MADVTLSDLLAGSPAGNFDGNEIFEVTQGGVSKGALASQILAYVVAQHPTIYTGDGSLAGDREIDLDGHSLNFEGNGNYFITLDPANNKSAIAAYNGDNNSGVVLTLHDDIGGDGANSVWNCYDNETTPKQATVELNGTLETIKLTAANGATLNGSPIATGPTIYTGDGSLSGDRVVDFSGHKMEFSSSIGEIGFGRANPDNYLFWIEDSTGEYIVHVDVTDGSQTSIFGAINHTNDGNAGLLETTAFDDQANASLHAVFNDVVGSAIIKAHADATISGVIQTSPPSTTASLLANGQISFYLDEGGSAAKIAVKLSDGTPKTITLPFDP